MGQGKNVKFHSADGAILYFKDDGISWAAVGGVTDKSLNTVAYGGGVFMTVGEGGVVLTSTDDGPTWTIRNTDTSNRLNGVTYGHGIFIAVRESNACFLQAWV
jgi:photosystem II stability/assembly factor-like uncharacterized protein